MNQKIKMPIAPIFLAILTLNALTSLRYFNIFNFFQLVIYAVPCVILFMKKRDNVLLIGMAVATMLKGLTMLLNLSIGNFLIFAAYVATLLCVLVLSEQTLLPLDLSSVRKTVKQLFFIPALIFLLGQIFAKIWLVQLGIGTITIVMSFLPAVLETLALLTLVQWLADPVAKVPAAVTAEAGVQAAAQSEYVDGYCGLGKHIVLCLFTCGIWPLIWIYRTTKFLNSAPGAEQHRPGCKLALCMFVPFYQIYWFYKQGQRIDSMSRAKNLGNSDMATICLLLGIFIPFVAYILMQDRINAICTAR